MEKVVSSHVDFLFKNPIAPAWQQIVLHETNKLRNINREMKITDFDLIIENLLKSIKENDINLVPYESLDGFINNDKYSFIEEMLIECKKNLKTAKMIYL